jgi:hypothetical protein
MTSTKRYLAYMLRLWRMNSAVPSDWQASLEDPHSGKKIGFANLESLLSYLRDQTSSNHDKEETSQAEEE